MKSGFKSADRQPILDESRQRYVEFDNYRQQNATDHSLAPPLLHIDSNRAKTASWRRIIDLDEFFTRIYEYHKRGGFWCMVLEDIFELLRFSFVAIFLGFLFTCVDYQILFRDKKLVRPGNQTDKVTLSDAVNFDSSKITFSVVLCIIIACVFWIYWLAVLLWKLSRHFDIRSFYYEILKIDDSSLPNLKWSEILTKLGQAQKTYQFCVHKTTLNEMEVYHQILRRKNYLVALVNKTLLPARFTLPLLGEVSYFTNGFKLNFEFLFFLGWYSPWQVYWRLKDEYKNPELIDQVSLKMENTVFYLAIINLLFSPVIFLWQIFYSLFSYGELVKREPGLLGVRRWSINGKYFLRHFNELDHELEYRLNMAYKPACQYLNMFRGNMLEILAQNLIFFLGAYVIVIIALSLYDQDVLLVQNVLTILTLSSLAIAACKSFISNENQVFCPELMLKILTTHLHYIPDFWKNRAHTSDVRRQFAQLFQFTATFVLEELFSPILTPFVLFFWLKPRCREFLEFFRRFTIEVPSLGDVCSFAMLDIRKHGDTNWQPAIETDKSIEQPDDSMIANLGKTELSLVHFQLANPNWNAPPTSHRFLTSIREKCQHDLDQASSTTVAPLDEEVLVNPLIQSLASLPMPYYIGLSEKGAKDDSGNGLVLSLLKKYQSQQQQMTTSSSTFLNFDQQKPFTNDQLLMSSLMISSNGGANTLAGNYFAMRNNETELEMSVTAAYLRELRDRKVRPRLRDYGSMQFSRTATSTAYKQRYLEEQIKNQKSSVEDYGSPGQSHNIQNQDFLWNVPGTSSRSEVGSRSPLLDLQTPPDEQAVIDEQDRSDDDDNLSGLPSVHYAP